MTVVSGSKQVRSVVVPHQPGRKGLYIFSFIALLVGVAALSFWLGEYSIKHEYLRLKAEREQLVETLSLSKAKLEETSQQFANAALGAEIDREAVNDVRSTVREHQQIIAELNEEISFYKDLMAPTDRERGLSIRSWEVYSTNDPKRFQFKLVAQQLAHKHALFSGSLHVKVVGLLLGEERELPLGSLSNKSAHQNIKLRFKYFQNIEGEIQLPEGFEPQRVDIVGKGTRPKVAQIERRYGWVVQQ